MDGLLQRIGQTASSHGPSQLHSDDTWRWPEAQAVTDPKETGRMQFQILTS